MAQNDTIVMDNGDKFIGEIKEMKNGVLTMETDYSDSDFTIKWTHIKKIDSDQYYLLTLKDGLRLNSDLHTKPKDTGVVDVKNLDKITTVKIEDIVYVKAVKTTFFSRLSASVSVGYNFTKSNSLSQFTVRSNIGYIADKWGFNGSYNSVRSSQEDVDETQRTDANIGAKYFLKNDWFVMLSGDFLSNEDQKLKLRSTIKGGLGKYIIHSNRVYFSANSGLAWNNERFTDAEEQNRNSLEAYLGLEINMFDFDDISLFSNITAYPSLTESGRIRTDFSLDLKYDLPLDFFIKVGLTHNFDSKPVEDAAKVDYIFQTTFGWEL
ncbi:DUF481 domain-containing protein [Galbibacter pacificus]|uniref:DUF481 domain-containing protein n=2 Tax=Galbibacter TaxID=379068 RepID=A0ABT6FVI1_9FLAO|nr:DUF481 domain-containing protein [Galbibacter pacificus]MDG3583802.1 DUF481 domain-containing protein [Galbibacter pacificus]MDG3587280.1 DUF481 domain-containing protein [Galbibacter pacificus]